MSKLLDNLPLLFFCLSLAYIIFRYEKNNNIAKEYYIIEGMTFYLIAGFLIGLVFKKYIFIFTSGGLFIGTLLGSILRKDRFY